MFGQLPTLLLLLITSTPSLTTTVSKPWGYVYIFSSKKVLPLRTNTVQIGRRTGNEIKLKSSRVSRRHAVIAYRKSDTTFFDVGSTNGSYLNGTKLNPKSTVPVRPGDLIQIADERMLYHNTITGLWYEELRLRLLSRTVRLKISLSKDVLQTSLNQEQRISAVTEANLNSNDKTIHLEYPNSNDLTPYIPPNSIAFIGNVRMQGHILELSLWTNTASPQMTSRRAAYSNLEHTTLKISMAEDEQSSVAQEKGPWFPYKYLKHLFEPFSDNRATSLQFSTALSGQQHTIAFRDTAETLLFRHKLKPLEATLFLIAAKSQALWVDAICTSKEVSITTAEQQRLKAGLQQTREWFQFTGSTGVENQLTKKLVCLDRN